MTERFYYPVYLLLETKDTFVSVHFFYSPARSAVYCGPPNWVPESLIWPCIYRQRLEKKYVSEAIELRHSFRISKRIFFFCWYTQQTAKAPRRAHRKSRHNGKKGKRIYDLCLNNVTYRLSLQIDGCVCVCVAVPHKETSVFQRDTAQFPADALSDSTRNPKTFPRVSERLSNLSSAAFKCNISTFKRRKWEPVFFKAPACFIYFLVTCSKITTQLQKFSPNDWLRLWLPQFNLQNVILFPPW